MSTKRTIMMFSDDLELKGLGWNEDATIVLEDQVVLKDKSTKLDMLCSGSWQVGI